MYRFCFSMLAREETYVGTSFILVLFPLKYLLSSVTYQLNYRSRKGRVVSSEGYDPLRKNITLQIRYAPRKQETSSLYKLCRA